MSNREALMTKDTVAGAEYPGATGAQGQNATPVKARPGRPSQRNPGETRARILASALACFTEKGFAATTFAAVARGAGLTGPAIYQYFDSKGALYAATLEHIYEELLPDINDALLRSQGFKDRLTSILEVAVAVHESNPAATAFLSSHPAEVRHDPRLKEHLTGKPSTILSALRQVFVDARSKGEISAERSVESLTMFFFGSVMGLCLYQHAKQATSMREAVEVLFDLIDNRLLPS